MTAADTEAMTALQDLLAERQQYQGWLRVLEARRGSTPQHVYERVHTDYSLRLDRVIQRLGERAEQLSATIDSLTTRLNAIRAREGEKTDERQEAELRAAVGEFAPEEWDRRRAGADEELAAIAADREAVESELDELQRVVALTREAPAPHEQQAPAPTNTENASDHSTEHEGDDDSIAGRIGTAPEGRADAVGNRSPSSAPGGGPQGAPALAADAAPSIDEFVADWPVAQVAADSATATAVASSGPQGDGVPDVPEIDRSPFAPRASAQANGPATRPAASGGAAPGAAAGGAARSGIAARAVGTVAQPRETPPAFESGREADKTLKCPECGAMNYATEWYCERCGGELSSY